MKAYLLGQFKAWWHGMFSRDYILAFREENGKTMMLLAVDSTTEQVTVTRIFYWSKGPLEDTPERRKEISDSLAPA